MPLYLKQLSNKLCLIFLLLIIFSNPLFSQDLPVVKIKNGYVKGITEMSSKVFKGVPYAEAPIGKLRFKSPQPVKNWRDTLLCNLFSEPATQYSRSTKKATGSEDCLKLNIYTKEISKQHLKPVLVWIHGGGMTSGSGMGENGHAFSDTDSIVTVTINYRLGVFGFLYLGDANPEYKGSGNNAVQDCVMALRWIRENISAFGGDPSRVTVMGESAGAKLASTLLVIPAAKGYFNQLILESGSLQCIRDTVTAKSIRKRLLDELQIKEPAQLLNMSAEELIVAQNKVCGGAQGTNYFGPVDDGYIISGDPYNYLSKKSDKNIKLLMGTNEKESILFMQMDKRLYNPDETVLQDWYGKNSSFVLSTYKIEAQKKDNLEAAIHTLTQYMYQMHTYRLANQLARMGNDIWMYRFNYNKDGSQATHGKELSYVWSFPLKQPITDKEKLAANMHRTWVNFIYGKQPGEVDGNNWSKYKLGSRTVMHFDSFSKPVKTKDVFNDPAYPSAGFILD